MASKAKGKKLNTQAKTDEIQESMHADSTIVNSISKVDLPAKGAMAKIDTFGPGGVVVNSYEIEARAVQRTKDTCIIVGCADSKNMVPWDKDAEYWGVNNLYGVQLKGAHYDRWFEIHNIEFTDGKYYRREQADFRGQPVDQYLKGLGKLKCPVIYMQQEWDMIPNSCKYPLDAITTLFGRYLTNTISYEIALAILMGFKRIEIWGVDMAVGTEYEHQRPSCEYFIGMAKGKGIDVFVPDEADLLKTLFLYGFEEPKKTAWEKKVTSIEKSMAQKQNQAQAQLEQAQNALNQYIGARYAVAELKKIRL